MTLAEFWNKHGRIEALKAIGEKKMACDLEKAEKYEESVMQKQGVIPFDKRPKSTQSKLNSANKIYFKADVLLWQKRKSVLIS